MGQAFRAVRLRRRFRFHEAIVAISPQPNRGNPGLPKAPIVLPEVGGIHDRDVREAA